MLATKTYSREYVATARAQVEADLAAYDAFADVVQRSDDAATLTEELDTFAPSFFTAMVLALEQFFAHRLRAVEGKDGNPLNEVRLLATGLTEHGGVLTGDKQIRIDPETSVLGLAEGDPVRLDADQFRRLSDAFFAEIEARFMEVE